MPRATSLARIALAAIIPLGRDSHHGSSSLPEGGLRNGLRRREGSASSLKNAAQRAGPALPSYLALHHAGFSLPPVSPPERWALTPPFHPCQTCEPFVGAAQVSLRDCHRAALRRRSVFCGTFRDAVVAPGLSPAFQLRPLALPGALPISSPALLSLRRWCPDFPPAQPSRDDQASNHPAHPLTSIIRSLTRNCVRIRSQ